MDKVCPLVLPPRSERERDSKGEVGGERERERDRETERERGGGERERLSD